MFRLMLFLLALSYLILAIFVLVVVPMIDWMTNWAEKEKLIERREYLFLVKETGMLTERGKYLLFVIGIAACLILVLPQPE